MSFTLSGASGTVAFSAVTDESVDLASKITSNPVEQGAPINDHMVNEEVKISIGGKLIGDQKVGQDTLKAFRLNREFVTYEGKERFEDCLINSLKFSHASGNATGVDFTASLQKIRIATAESVPVSARQSKMSEQDKSAKVSSKGASASKKENATAASKAKSKGGRQTPQTQAVSSASYGGYVNSFNGKNSNKGTAQSRSTPSYSGVKGG